MKKFIPLILILLLFTLLQATGKLVPRPQDIPVQLEQDPNLLSGKLENGLSYYIMRNPRPEGIAELRLYIDVGSVNEDDDQRGLAHFTEHMAFNGTKHFGRTEMVEYLSSIGMGYYNGLNGMTSYDFTAYTFRLPTTNREQLRKGLLIMSDMASQVSFDPAEIERERGVIIEEWRMGQDANTRVRDAQNAVVFAGSRYAERAPIGTYEVLSTFTPQTIRRFYRDWYRPDLQSVVIVGDFDPQDMLALVREFFGPIPKRDDPRPRQDFEVPNHPQPRAVVATDPEFPRNLLSVSWQKGVRRVQTLPQYFDETSRNLFHTMLNSRLEEKSKEADPPFSAAFSYEYPALRTMSQSLLMCMFGEGKAEAALTTLLTEAERVNRHGFTASELDRAKLDLLRSAESQLADSDTRESGDIAWEIIDCIANQRPLLSPQQEYELLGALLQFIDLGTVNSLVGELVPENNMVIVLGAPAREGLQYPDERRLLQIAAEVGELELEAYEDVALDEPLLDPIPAPLPLKKEKHYPRSGISRWELANGIVVYGKKTDFKADELLFQAVSPGGYSRYPAEDIPAARLLADYVRDSGFGKFDAMALQKATAGKVASAGISLGLYSEGISGQCSPKDMELMFQLIHQYATNARFNQKDFESFIQRYRSRLANRELDPQQVFADKLGSAMYDHSPYRRPITVEDLDRIDLRRMEQIYLDRFADLSDFTFIFVGNYDEQQLLDCANRYLANLPKARRKDRIVDAGVRLFKGQKLELFRKGESDRSFVSHVTNGGYKATPKNDMNLNALTLVLNEKLRENIREELSGVYFIQAWPGKERYPTPSLTFTSMMACSPARVEELNRAIFATLDSIRAGYIDERYLVSTKATLTKTLEEDLRTNYYWLNQIYNSVWQKKPLEGFLAMPSLVDKIDRKAVAKAAKKYLTFDRNKLSVIMLPAPRNE